MELFSLDTTILLEMNFGSKIKKSNINRLLQNSPLFTTRIIIGEFRKVTMLLIKKIISNYRKKQKFIKLYDNFSDFSIDISKDIPVYSIHQLNLLWKLINFFSDEIFQNSELYEQEDYPISIMCNKIIDDFNNSEYTFLENISIIEDSFLCEYRNREIIDQQETDEITLTKSPCPKCKNSVLDFFINKYQSNIHKIHDNYSIISKDWDTNESGKFLDSIHSLISYEKNEKINSNPCRRLIDLFFIFETPLNMTIVTTNKRHFEPIINFLLKKGSYI